MHIKTVCEHKRRAVLHVLGKVIAIDVALQLVGRKHHHHVSPFGRLGDLYNLEFLSLGFFHGGRGFAQRDGYLLHAAIAQVECVGGALTSVAADGDLLALDQVQVCVAILVNAHDTLSSLFFRRARRFSWWYLALGGSSWVRRQSGQVLCWLPL